MMLLSWVLARAETTVKPNNTEIINVDSIRTRKLARNRSPKWICDIIIFKDLDKNFEIMGSLYEKQGME